MEDVAPSFRLARHTQHSTNIFSFVLIERPLVAEIILCAFKESLLLYQPWTFFVDLNQKIVICLAKINK